VIVDAHVHLLPGRLAVKVRAFLEQGVARMAYPIDHDVVLAQLAACGVGQLWNLPYAHKAGIADGLNESMAEIAGVAGPVGIISGATVHPADPDPVSILRRAVEDLGSRVLKLHCSVGDYAPDDPRLDGVWAYAQDIHLPVVVHVGHGVNGCTTADELAPLGAVATRFPEARIVIAHSAHEAVDAALDLVEAHDHVHADLTPVVTSPVVIPAGRLAAVAPKLQFGSDAPNTAIEVGAGLTRVRELPLARSLIDGILGGHAAALVAGVLA
jgi:predicted TIM-barrel fold metal-dependent hydrolase